MTDLKRKMEKMVEELRHSRDELNLQMHLANAEVKEDWTDLERKWGHLRSRTERIGEEAGEAAEDISQALSLLGEELRKGYKRIRKAI